MVAGSQAATSDVVPFFFQDGGPQAVGVVRLAEIFVAKTQLRFFQGPGLIADEAADFGIGVHGDERRFILRLVGAEEQTFCFEKGHGGWWNHNLCAGLPGLRL